VAKIDIKCMAETMGGVHCPKTATGTYPTPMPYWCRTYPYYYDVTLALCDDHAPAGYRNVWSSFATEKLCDLPEGKP